MEMGTPEQQYLSEERREIEEQTPFSSPAAPSVSEQMGPRKAYASAERRWAKAFQNAKQTARFEESQKAQKPEPTFRRGSPAEYRHGSSLL